MKIAFLTPEYPHIKIGSSGGLGTSIHHLAHALVALGHQVHLLIYSQALDVEWEEEGIIFHQIKNVKWKGISWLLTRKKIEKYIDRLYLQGRVDLVEAPDWTGITSFIQPKRCPIVIRLNGSDTYFCHLENRKVKWINRFHEKRALQKAKGHISVSEFTANTTNQIFGLNILFEIIPNSINCQNFENTVIGDRNQLLYLGTLIRKKGVLEIPAIFNHVVEKMPNVTLHLVGADASDIQTSSKSTWQLMQALFSEKAIKRVQYHGKMPYHQVKNFLEKASVVIFPSFAEALPLAWLEAMAMQKAIVASNIGWAKEVIVDGKEGLLVHPQNHQEFAEKVIRLLNDKEMTCKFGNQAKQKVHVHFSSKLIAQKSLEFYQKVLQQ